MARDEANGWRPRGRKFETTRWSVVLAAADSRSSSARSALEDLCRAYWPPVYAYIRRRGHDRAAAQDLTQGFFAHLLEGKRFRRARPERGRFRSFLLTAVRNYIANERDRARAQKRGGGSVPLGLDFEDVERECRIEAASLQSPDRIFERRWALTLLRRVLDRLREETSRSGGSARAERLLPFLTEDGSSVPYATVAEELGMTESAVKVAVHRLRKRYGALLREEIADVVDSEEDVDREIRDLFAAVRPGS